MAVQVHDWFTLDQLFILYQIWISFGSILGLARGASGVGQMRTTPKVLNSGHSLWLAGAKGVQRGLLFQQRVIELLASPFVIKY